MRRVLLPSPRKGLPEPSSRPLAPRGGWGAARGEPLESWRRALRVALRATPVSAAPPVPSFPSPQAASPRVSSCFLVPQPPPPLAQVEVVALGWPRRHARGPRARKQPSLPTPPQPSASAAAQPVPVQVHPVAELVVPAAGPAPRRGSALPGAPARCPQPQALRVSEPRLRWPKAPPLSARPRLVRLELLLPAAGERP